MPLSGCNDPIALAEELEHAALVLFWKAAALRKLTDKEAVRKAVSSLLKPECCPQASQRPDNNFLA